MRKLAIVVSVLCVFVLGCTKEDKARANYSQNTASVYVDDEDASHLATDDKPLQQVCAIAGTCDAVFARCYKNDHTGKTFWNITVPGADSSDVLGSVTGVGDTLDEAAKDFVLDLRQEKARLAFKKIHPDEVAKISPCGDCRNSR